MPRNDPRNGGSTYAGYGMPPLTPQAPPSPEGAIEECLRAIQQIFKDTLQMNELAPWIHPPFRGRSICEHERVILSVTAAVDAGVNAAGLALQAALTVPGPTPYIPTLVEMSGAGDYKTIFEYKQPTNITTRFKSWGVTINNVAPEGVFLRVGGGNMAAGPPSPPNPLLGTSEAAGQQPLFLLIPGKQTLKVEGALRDPTSSPALIDFGICGWSWAVRQDVDSPEGVIPRSGYGLNCS